jgi:hypothetical protein
VEFGVDILFIAGINAASIKGRGSENAPRQLSSGREFFDSLSPERAVNARDVDIACTVEVDALDPVQLGRVGELARNTGKDAVERAERADFLGVPDKRS